MGIFERIGADKKVKEEQKKVIYKNMDEFKERYNFLTKRRIKAETWMENPNTKMEDIEKHLPSYYEIIKEISNMMHQFEQQVGRKMNDTELFEGFK